MKGTITKVDPPRRGSGGRMYRLVCFRMEQGGSARSFISENMKNYTKWKPLLEKGNIIDGLKMKGDLIDGDSVPVLFFKPEKQEELF